MQAALELLSRPCSSRYASQVLRQAFTSRHYRAFVSSRPKEQQESSETAPKLTSPVGYVSDSTDPWFNLSYEDWLLRNTLHNEPTLFIYRNTPCVVIGRNQNPWKESTPKWLRQEGTPLIRRRSGGGTVFHDLGNVNFSIILPRLLFTRNHSAELVARAVRDRLGIGGCTVNDRNDVVIRTGDKDLKVSGSAYKIIQNRAYHHGTMLISSDLSNLGTALRSSSPNMETKGIPSFRSPVTTLNSHLPPGQATMTTENFIDAVTREFSMVYAGSEDGMTVIRVIESGTTEPKVWAGVEEMKSWEWTYGQTPEFTNTIQTEVPQGTLSATIHSRKALITGLSFGIASEDSPQGSVELQRALDDLAQRLIGKRYEELDISSREVAQDEKQEYKKTVEDVLEWLRNAM